ncbi:RGS domain-containing protein [Kockovaella imperatae]|uniref:RGS domain-containing protein n=1 Tax=Kockovaella imperatae TaxID=4999 RepID=A0A1Y1UDQ1_9TREE|nr:RGS domain-containing protein [Kockovaella imperatae]ORX36163.1 RGS domain-containing protein [Kockovaella imperatae]
MDEKSGVPAQGSSNSERRMSSRYLKLERLPTLQEVLDRRTRAPLDLFCFYIFLQRESAEDALDFWLDVQQHENMCKAYFKDLRRSGRSVQDDWPEFATYARTNGSHFSPMLSLAPGASDDDAHFSSTSSGLPRKSSELMVPVSPRPLSPTSPAMRERRDTESHGPDPRSSQLSAAEEIGIGRPPIKDRPGHTGGAPSRQPSRWARGSRIPTVIQRERAIEKAALVESAERIYLRYLLPGAEREIYLPPSLRLNNFPISSKEASPLIPDLFHNQKVYIFRALEQDAFPRFLRAKAFGNLTPLGCFARLVAGLFFLWGGFVIGFSLIFLDHEPRLDRLWIILPFFLATNLLFSAFYSLSPLLALLQQSETTPFRLITVRESYVRKLLFMRALWIEAVCIVVTAVLTVIFAVVPGHRL